MSRYVLSFEEAGAAGVSRVGGKGANLGRLSGIEDIRVPGGFCVTTEAYKCIIGQIPDFGSMMEQLSLLKAEDRDGIDKVSQRVRKSIERIKIPRDMEKEIDEHITKLGPNCSCAVRSSATAEDLPTASFAGQQDTYLNVTGRDAILLHIRKCWASLFTGRAVTYRIQNGFDHRKAYLAVVVQQMAFPLASGIMFTADPVTSNRKVLSIDAGFGLGEALVSGLVNADIYKVRDGDIVDRKIFTKKMAVYALEDGGTVERDIEPGLQNVQALTDRQILQLEGMGRRIEAFFGCPQDIEWCYVGEHTSGPDSGEFFILQSRPITTLYPIPEGDGKNRVYASMGHLQMMTEVIKPLGMSFCKLLSFWFGQNLAAGGGRLFIDGTYDLASPVGRNVLIKSTGNADILMKNALLNLLERKDFMKSLPRGKGNITMDTGALAWIIPAIKIYRRNDISTVEGLIRHNEELIRDMEQRIERLSGDELFEFILKDTIELKSVLTGPQNMRMMVVGGFVSTWINKKMEKWLGEKGAADILSKSVPNNVTSEMGLELMDVAYVAKQYPKVIEYFAHAHDETFFEDLNKLEGGGTVGRAVRAYLEKYGMRCPGEIDITKPRWSEKPTALIPIILSNMNNPSAGSGSEKFEQGRLEAQQKEQELINRLEQLPGGRRKAKKTRKMISVLRNFIGFREYPKYSFIKRFQAYKNALLREAEVLVQKGIIREKEDIYYLYFEELREVVRTSSIDYSIIAKRKEEYRDYEKLTPPRLMTSDGEVISGEYNSGHIPKGALAGVAVSPGVVEGRARVVSRLEDAIIEDGDILVTVFTDPSWTSLFVSVRGLVTEVGGRMTHGAVITREYGLPAVVGVENATKLIKDGQRIRVNGTEGYVEIL